MFWGASLRSTSILLKYNTFLPPARSTELWSGWRAADMHHDDRDFWGSGSRTATTEREQEEDEEDEEEQKVVEEDEEQD